MNELMDAIPEPDVNLDELISIPQNVNKPPLNSIRSRAAVTALLSSNPDKMVSDYQAMVAEADTGSNTLYNTRKALIVDANKQLDMKGVMSVLADPTIPFDRKQAIIQNLNQSQFKFDQRATLVSNGLIAESKGENPESETARISTADALAEITENASTVQGIVNAHGASLDSASAGTFGEMLEAWVMPFGNTIVSGKIANKLAEAQGTPNSAWKKIKNYLLPGSATLSIREQFEQIPVDKRPEFARQLVDVLKQHSGIIFTNENQFAQFDKASNIFEEGGYSDTQAFLDNIAPLLDAVGIGQAIRSGKRAVRLNKPSTLPAGPNQPLTPRDAPPAPPMPSKEAPDAPLKDKTFPVGIENLNRPVDSKQVPKLLNPQGWVEVKKAVEQKAALLAKAPSAPAPVAKTEGEVWFTGSPSAGKTEGYDLASQSLRENADVQKAGPGQYITQSKELAGTYGGKTGRLYEVEAPFSNPFDFNKVDPNTKKSGETLYKEMTKELGSRTKVNQKLAEMGYDAITFTDSRGNKIANIFNKRKLKDIGPARPETKPLGELSLVSDELSRVEINNTVKPENPASPAKLLQNSNPEKAQAAHIAVWKSEGDEVAQALYGTDKITAIASDVLPQAATASGAVRSRIPAIMQSLKEANNIPDEMLDVMHSAGGLQFTKEELATARANVVNDFKSASGLTINDAMSSFAVEGDRIKISAVYGMPSGSFSTPENALQQAMLALKQYGIKLEEITLLKKNGIDHVPVDALENWGKEGNYLIRIDTFHEVDPTDVGRMMEVDVKRNFLDRVSPWLNTFLTDPARWIADASSMLHPIYTAAATQANDLTARFDKFMLNLADDYAEKWKALDKNTQNAVNLYIREANFNEIPFDVADLVSRGFNQDAIDAIRSWRNFWDAHYYLENYDVIRTLNAEGYQLFDIGGTKLVAKETAKNRTLAGTNMYSHGKGDVTQLTAQEIDDLYNKGGYVAKLRRPATFASGDAEYMIVENNNLSYLRKIRDTDEILNYREGYFQIQYNAPKFVDEITRDSAGRITKRRAVAVAGDSNEAKMFANRMKQNTGGEYEIRGDDRAMQRGNDDWWDIHSASGRIAQRSRGKLLEDASGLNHLGDMEYIMNPVESAIRAAKSIAGRTVTRPVLEAAKARFMQQYDEFLTAVNGQKRFPSDLSQIGSKGDFTSSELADARTTWQYINYLENGYINGIDTFSRAMFNMLGQWAGEKNLTKLERASNQIAETNFGPIAFTKSFIFHAYLGTNPLRQLIVQTHQAVRTWAYNPMGWVTGNNAKYASGWLGEIVNKSIPMSADMKDFNKFFSESGLVDNVDKQNLVRGALVDAAESTNPVVRAGGKALAVPRKIGFDAGEIGNLLAHAAAVYDRYKRLGKNVADKRVKAEMVSEIRALSYEMNFAGDMPYNQTSAAAILQFMQVPHKAFLQMTNRKLDRATRARLIVGDMLFWGPPTFIVSSLMGGDILPDDPELREKLSWGLEGIALNHLFTELFGEETNIDWSGLAPYDTTGWAQFFTSMNEGGLNTLLLNSPAGQMFLREGGRFDNAVSAMGRYFAGFVEEQQKPETFTSMLHEVAKISSGYNNAQEAYAEWIRARLATDAIRRLDKYGSAIDTSVTNPEIVAKLFGFGTASTRDLYRTAKEVSKDTKKYREDVLKVYNSAKQYYARTLAVENSDTQFMTSVTGYVINVFKDDPQALKIIYDQMKLDMMGKDQALLGQIMRRSGVPDAQTFKDDVRRSPLTEEQKQKFLERIDDLQNAREQLKQMRENNKEQ